MVFFWIGFIIVAAYLAFIAWTIVRGTFARVFMGSKIVSIKIAIQIFGLGLMLMALIIFWLAGPEQFALSDGLLMAGLLCAIPAAIYLIIYMIYKFLFTTDEQDSDNSNVNQEWFLAQQEEATEREAKAALLAKNLEDELAQRDAKLKSLENEIQNKHQEIHSQIQTETVAPEILAQLESEKETLESQKGELSQEKNEIEQEKKQLEDERRVMLEEKERLEADRKRLEQLEQSVLQASQVGNENMLKALENEMGKFKTEQTKQVQNLEGELAAARGEIENLRQQNHEDFQQYDVDRTQLEADLARARNDLEQHYTNSYQDSFDADYNHIERQMQSNITELEQALARITAIEAERSAKLALNKEKRTQAIMTKREILSRENVEKHLRRYYLETCACFLMNRDEYKDKFGISPYNRIVVEKNGKVTHHMTATKDKLMRFSEILVDVETFFNHKLLQFFTELVNEGTSLVRISEKLHVLYLKFYKKDFVKDYRYKDDFDNLLLLVSNHNIARGFDFRGIFVSVPFDVRSPFEDADLVAYLNRDSMISQFSAYFTNWSDLGFQTMYQAMVVAFATSQKDKIPVEILINFTLKDANRIAKTLEKLNKPRPPR